jgi:2-dehydro-3-deoxygluconokinase
MVRLSPPGHGRLEFARTLEVDVGGGEFNVAYGVARLGLRTGFVSRLPDNAVAAIILNHARAAGMDVSAVKLTPPDGVGRRDRVGLNFTEVGMGLRPSVTLYDRGHTAMSLAQPEDFDFEQIFSAGCRWLHTGGVMAAISAQAPAIVERAIDAAKAVGARVSFDLNYRASLWTPAQARAVVTRLMPKIDVLFGNEDAFDKMLGIAVPGARPTAKDFNWEENRNLALAVVERFPHLRAIASSLRAVPNGSVNHLSGLLWYKGEFSTAREYRDLQILDRVGGGDAFGAGIVYGLLNDLSGPDTVELAAAYGALVHTARGDTSQATLREVMHIVEGGSAVIQR